MPPKSKQAGLEIPKEWTFESALVAENFDAHVREQLPWYELVTASIAHLGRHYIPQNGVVYDLGAATGNIGRTLAETLTQRNATLYAVEPSAQMLERYKAPGVKIHARAEDADYQPFDFAVVFLTMQFVNIHRRAQLVETLTSKLRPGGAVVLLDKFEAAYGYLGTALYRLTLAHKLAAGATPSAIINKELSLGGVQRPLQREDYQGWQPFFQFGDFAGLIFTK